MRPGIKIINETIGSGDEILKGKTAIINLRMFLPDSKEISSVIKYGQKMKIDLSRRDTIAGLRYGIEGMRIGGIRNFVIRPHLAYGQQGLENKIPPNSPLRCEVELLEIRDNPHPTQEEYPPGKVLGILHPGELSRLLIKYNFGISEDGNYGAFVTVPIPNLKWRHSRPRYLKSNIDSKNAERFIQWASDFPKIYPNEAISKVHNEGGDSSWYTNDQKDVVCFNVNIREQGKNICNYYVPETSINWNKSEMQNLIHKLLTYVKTGEGQGIVEVKLYK